MLPRLLLCLVVAICSTAMTALAQVDIRVQLMLPVDSTATADDWKQLESYDIVVTIVNNSPAAIEVPQTYSAGGIRLCASGSNGTRWPLCLTSRRPSGGLQGREETNDSPEEMMVRIAPGTTHEVLRVSTEETLIAPGNIYALKPLEEFAVTRWVWGWRARPGADYSPFERRKGDGRSETAVLWGEFDFDGQVIRSVPQLIHRKQFDAG